MVLRRKESRQTLGVACPGAAHPPGGCLNVIGDRSERTCRRLWRGIPESYKRGRCYSDFWEAYRGVIPEEHHEAVSKESGELAHVERWNNTLRQRLARFVRKTLSFSKSDEMHEACLKLFLHRHNESVILR